MSIVITGASGQLGRLTAELVLDRVPASEVILTTRRPEVLSDLAERGVRIRQADFDRPETLAEAFAGGENLLLISTDDLGRRAAQHRAAIVDGRPVSAIATQSLEWCCPKLAAIVAAIGMKAWELIGEN